MIESIIESRPWLTAAAGGTLTTGVGTDTAVGLTGCVTGDIIMWTDDAGAERMGQLQGANQFYENTLSAATAVSAVKVVQDNQTTPWFKADNSLLKQPIVEANQILGVIAYFNAEIIRHKVNINEGVTIKGIYVRLPYQYTLADTNLAVKLFHIDNTEAMTIPLTTVGEAGEIVIPTENIEIPMNAYVPPMEASAGFYSLGFRLEGAVGNVSSAAIPYFSQISQIDAPAALNNLFIPMYVGIRIVHADVALLP